MSDSILLHRYSPSELSAASHLSHCMRSIRCMSYYPCAFVLSSCVHSILSRVVLSFGDDVILRILLYQQLCILYFRATFYLRTCTLSFRVALSALPFSLLPLLVLSLGNHFIFSIFFYLRTYVLSFHVMFYLQTSALSFPLGSILVYTFYPPAARSILGHTCYPLDLVLSSCPCSILSR